MLLTVTSRSAPARDLGHLLRKHPDQLQAFPLPFGTAHVFYPKADDDECTAALHVEVDPVALVRGRGAPGESGGLVDAYVNDRPYAASSLLSVAITRVFGAALGGRSQPEELARRELALEATIGPVRLADSTWPGRLFSPLGYRIDVSPAGASYAMLRIAARTTVARLLTHVYVLLPVLDGDKHYWVGDEEVEKLFRFGGDWLTGHPEREFITSRYLSRAPKLARAAVARLAALDDAPSESPPDVPADGSESALERPLRLQDRRISAAIDALRTLSATTIADVGCGDGDLVVAMAREAWPARIVGTDVSVRELERAKERLERSALPATRRERVELFQSSAVYADARLKGLDAIVMLEVIEHVDPDRLPALEAAIFGAASPRAIVVTTPNHAYNARFGGLAPGAFRHTDHRFEWARPEFEAWTTRVAERFRYSVTLSDVGDSDPDFGAPTQMAVFRCL